MASVVNMKSKEELDAVLAKTPNVAIHFWATWCEPCTHMDKMFSQLASENPGAAFVRVEAEEVSDLSEQYEVTAVPFFVLIKGGIVVDRLEGANPTDLTAKVAKHLSTPKRAAASAAASNISGGAAVTSEPGSTLGGAAKRPIKERLKDLTASKPVMLFMKGSPEAPRCGFSSKVVAALKEEGVPFGSFDILSDEDVRQGLKEYSNWPTYPQLYVAGELVGGCDIILEMHTSGELKELLLEKKVLGGGGANGAEDENSLESRLKKIIKSNDTMLFMKGTPDAPRCGFSSKVVAALREEDVKFGSFDILSDEDIRQGLKEFSNWPTYPQLYHKGELIGGCDIILEMHKSGDLKEALTA